MKRRPVDARHVPERLLRTLETGRAGIRICTAAVKAKSPPGPIDPMSVEAAMGPRAAPMPLASRRPADVST